MLSLPNLTEITPSRDVTVFGESTPKKLDPVEVGYLLDAPVPAGQSGYTQSGRLYAARDCGLKDQDRIPLPEGDFRIIGPAQLDYNHPMTAHDFGIVRFRIQLGG